MDINSQRRIDHFVGVPVCALLSLLERLRWKRPVTASPGRILVLLLSEMGSLVLARPMFSYLKRRYPHASIHVMVFAKNREVLDLLGVVPESNVLTLNDRSLGAFVSDLLAILRRMRTLRFDAVIDCELFARISSILSFFSGASVRVGFHPHTQEGLYRGSHMNRPVLYNPYQHISQQFLTLAFALESGTHPVAKDAPAADFPETPLFEFRQGERKEMTARLHADFPAIRGENLVLVYPSGGILPIRAWPLEHYGRLCNALLTDGYAVGIIGLQSDKPIARILLDHCKSSRCIDLTGYTTSVRELLTLFERASLLITNDGGPVHFAALTRIPSILFFGPETPVLYGSLTKNAHCFYLSIPCSPCLSAYNHRTSPCDGDNQCLKRIPPEQVLAKARQMLEAVRTPDPAAGEIS
jgi:lipopolysaccharide heptosyltransferase II